MSAHDFLQLVAQTGMVSEPVLEELRKRIASTKREIRTEILAKLLVDRGELTPAQARKLVAASEQGPPVKPPPPPAPPQADPEPEPELTLVDEEDDEPAFKLVEVKPPAEAELDLLEEVEQTPEAILIDDEPEALLLDEPSAAPPTPPSQPPIDLDPELDDILNDPLELPEAPSGPRLAPRRRGIGALWNELFGRKKPTKARWDSPLILFGGGALILLVFVGAGLVAFFRSESGDELFNAADELYRSRSYAQAVKNYEKFARSFPEHEKASLARIRVKLAQLRQVAEGTKDWEAAAAAARDGLPTIQDENAFGDARPELAGLLPTITAGLVEKARSADPTDEKQRLIDLATESLDLVNNSVYLPTSVRRSQESRIEDIEASIRLVQRGIDRDRTLRATIENIKTTTAAGKISEAYALRDQLLNSYPILQDDSSLRDALAVVAGKERDAVRISPGKQTAETEDHPQPSHLSVVFSDQRGRAAEGVQGQVLCYLLRGAVYGIDATDGKVLWRRHVGYGSEVFPQSIDASVGSDLVLVDTKHHELMRVDATTGKLRWRLPCNGPIGTPRLMAGRALVTCGPQSSAVLRVVDLESGAVQQQVEFPVGCTAAPEANPDRHEIIQLGAHSSLYVLDATSLKCKRVIPSGHARESVQVGPAAIGNFLLVCENFGGDASRLHVFRAQQDDKWTRVGEPLRMQGQVFAPLVVDQRRVLVMTDIGQIHVFEAPLDQPTLRQVASQTAGGQASGMAFSLLHGSDLWLGDRALTRFELQATRGQLVGKWVRYQDDRYLGPLRRVGSYLFQIRRRAGMLGATVAATPTGGSHEGEPVWETDIGVPSAVVGSNGGRTVEVLTANGAMFSVDAEAVRSGVAHRQTARLDPRLLPQAMGQPVRLARHEFFATGPAPSAQLVRLNLETRKLAVVPLRLDSDKATAELVAFHGAVLVACDTGPIHLVSPSSGQPQVSPFLPRVEPGSPIHWLRPAVIQPSHEFIAGARSGDLYRVALDGDGKTLRQIKKNRIESELVAGLATVGQVAYAALHGNGGAELVAVIDPDNLTVRDQTPLVGGVAWGPRRVGDAVLVTDTSGTAYCFDGQGELRWKLSQKLGQLAGTPLATSDGYVFASKQGLVTVVDAQGQVQGTKEMPEPLGSGPVAWANRLLLTGWDGTLYLINVPK